MARNLDPKCKQCRRAGEKLFLKGERCFSPKCPIVRRNYPPGQHGPNSRLRLSSYGQHLREKQKVKRMYRLLETQFANYFHAAAQHHGNTGEVFLQSLETRLDNVVFRLGLAESRDQARQLTTHGHIMVNDDVVSLPSAALRVGDVVSVKPSSAQLPLFEKAKKAAQTVKIPSWLGVDLAQLRGTVNSLPSGDELNQGLQVQLIVEYYAR